jgi:transcriptional regulator with XRE-family HTH domain
MDAKKAVTRLTIARLAAGLQQRELAAMAALSPARLCEYEQGAKPPASRSALLARVLGYSTQALVPDDMLIEETEVRRWLGGDPCSLMEGEEPAPTPALRNHADAGGGHGAG